MEDVFTGSPKEAPKMAKKRAIGEIFDMNMLRDIRRIFSENDNGDDSLNEEQFREVSRTLWVWFAPFYVKIVCNSSIVGDEPLPNCSRN
jgi:hypothetical protein